MLNEEGATSEALLLELLALRAAGLPPRKLLRLFLSDEAKPAELPLDLSKDIDCYREMIERALPLGRGGARSLSSSGHHATPLLRQRLPDGTSCLGRSATRAALC